MFSTYRRNWKKIILNALPWIILVLLGISTIALGFIKSKSEGKIQKNTKFVVKNESFIKLKKSTYRPQRERVIKVPQKIKLLGEFSIDSKNFLSNEPNLVPISTFVLKDVCVTKDGKIMRNGVVFKTNENIENEKPITTLEKGVVLTIPNGSDISQSRFYATTRLASVDPSFLSETKLIVTNADNDISDIAKLFYVKYENIVVVNGPVLVKEATLFEDIKEDEIPASILYMDQTILKQIDKKPYGNSITIIPNAESHIYQVKKAHEELVKDPRFVVRNIPVAFADYLAYMAKNNVAVSFQFSVCLFSFFMRQTSTIIYVQKADEKPIYPLISVAAGVKTYVLGLKGESVTDGVIKCIKDIVAKEYPDESSPISSSPIEEIVLVQ